MVQYKGFHVGQRVTVKKTDTAYDSFGDICPGDIGTLKAFPPKVRIVKGPLYDRLPYFAYVEFDKVKIGPPLQCHQNNFRAGIDICNLEKA